MRRQLTLWELTHRYRISEELQFDDWKKLLSKGKVADAVIIAVLVSIRSLIIVHGDANGLGPHARRSGRRFFSAGLPHSL